MANLAASLDGRSIQASLQEERQPRLVQQPRRKAAADQHGPKDAPQAAVILRTLDCHCAGAILVWLFNQEIAHER
jgi:hypothetical protein